MSKELQNGTIRHGSCRALFAEMLSEAIGQLRARPSPMATSYLVELLDTRVKALEVENGPANVSGTLAEELLGARLESGQQRVRRLRDLGDRALFVAGFFGESLSRSLVDIDYYRDIGRAAYGDLSRNPSLRDGSGSWTDLYSELSGRFHDFVDLLAEVGDSSRPGSSLGLLRVYERYVRTGSSRDLAQLQRRGIQPLALESLRQWQ